MKHLLWLFPLFLLSSCSLQLHTHRYTGGFHLSGNSSTAVAQSVARFRIKPLAPRQLTVMNLTTGELAAQKTVDLKPVNQQSGKSETVSALVRSRPITGFTNRLANHIAKKSDRQSPSANTVNILSGRETEPMAPISMVFGIAGVIMLFNEPLVAFGFLALVVGLILALISVSKHNQNSDKFWTKNLAMAALYLNGIGVAICAVVLLMILGALNSL